MAETGQKRSCLQVWSREMLHGKCEGVNRKQTGWRHGVSRHYCLTNTKVFFPEISPQMSCGCGVKQENLVNIDVVVFFLQHSTTDEIREKKQALRVRAGK